MNIVGMVSLIAVMISVCIGFVFFLRRSFSRAILWWNIVGMLVLVTWGSYDPGTVRDIAGKIGGPMMPLK